MDHCSPCSGKINGGDPLGALIPFEVGAYNTNILLPAAK
jgi:hypothetical protein